MGYSDTRPMSRKSKSAGLASGLDGGLDGGVDRGFTGRPDPSQHPLGEDIDEEPEPLAWNAGADLGLLLLRLVLGGIFIAHGGQKVFGWFGGPGLDGFADDLGKMGYSPADMLAAVTGFTELVGGGLVVLGLFTPLAAAGLAGVLSHVILMKWGAGLFAVDGGYELELALAGLAGGLALAGPGRVALDNGRVWYRHPVTTGLLCLLAAGGAAVAVRIMFRN